MRAYLGDCGRVVWVLLPGLVFTVWGDVHSLGVALRGGPFQFLLWRYFGECAIGSASGMTLGSFHKCHPWLSSVVGVYSVYIEEPAVVFVYSVRSLRAPATNLFVGWESMQGGVQHSIPFGCSLKSSESFTVLSSASRKCMWCQSGIKMDADFALYLGLFVLQLFCSS